MADDQTSTELNEEEKINSIEDLKSYIDEMGRNQCIAIQDDIFKMKFLSFLTLAGGVALAVVCEKAYLSGMIGIDITSVLVAVIATVGYCCFSRLCKMARNAISCQRELRRGLENGFDVTQKMVDDFKRGDPIAVKIGNCALMISSVRNSWSL